MARSLSAREKKILIVCLAMVAFYLIYSFGYQKIKEVMRGQESAFLRNEKSLRKYAHVLRSERAIEQKLAGYIKALKQNGSDEQEMTRVLSDIEAVADKVSIRIINMAPEKIKKSDFYNYFSVDVQLEGPLKKICEFLYALESKANYFHVDEMRIEKYSARADTLKCRLVVSRFLIP